MAHAASARVALVTGGGSGIGRATAIRLAHDGYRIAITGRRENALLETADIIGSTDTLVLASDVTEADAVSRTVEAVQRSFGRIDVLVNNAGISRTSALADIRLSDWRRVMAVNVESIVLTTQAALPALLESQGSVVNVASLAGLGGDQRMTMYNASKGAVVNLTRSLAIELGPLGVRVNAVAPSLTATDATADIPAADVVEFIRRIPLGRAAEPAEVASVIAFLASADASFVNGAIIPVDGGVRASSGQPPHR